MKEIDKIKYFDIADICKIFQNKISEDEIIKFFEDNKIKGKKVEDNWYAAEDEIDNFTREVLLKERAVIVDLHKIDFSDIHLEGRILDIGGGGEGIIGQLNNERVVAIDRSKRELEEAPNSGDLKIIMDARELKFLENTFDSVTAFFTLMYIPLNDHKKIFQEIYRVLKYNGELSIWELKIPKKIDLEKDFYGINLEVKIKEKLVETGYVVQWNKEQEITYYLDLGKSIGFEIIDTRDENSVFYIRFRKV